MGSLTYLVVEEFAWHAVAAGHHLPGAGLVLNCTEFGKAGFKLD